MAQTPGQPATQPHVPSPSSVLSAIGIFFVVAAGFMAGIGVYLPWWHYQQCDSTYDNCAPYIPATQNSDLTAPILLILVACALISAAFAFLLLIRPTWRARSVPVQWSLVLAALTLIAAFFATGLVALFGEFANFMAIISKILDPGYFLTLIGLSLLLPGATILLVAQSRWRGTAPGAVPVGAYRPQRFSSAVLREVLLPGTGAAYVGRAGIALGWWLGTTLGGLAACIFVFLSINTMDGLASNATNGDLNPLPVLVIVGILVILLGSWLAARIWAVREWVRVDNAVHAIQIDHPAERHQERAWDRGRFVSGAAVAIGAATLLLTLSNLAYLAPPPPLNPPIMAAELISLAFWLSLVYLWEPATSLAALGRVLLLVAVLAVGIVVVSLVLAILFARQYTALYFDPTYLFTHELTFVIVTLFMLPLFVAMLGGYGSALFSANWPAVHAEARGQAPLGLVRLLPLAGILTFFPAAFITRFNYSANLVLVCHTLLPFIGILWIVGTAAVACWRRAHS